MKLGLITRNHVMRRVPLTSILATDHATIPAALHLAPLVAPLIGDVIIPHTSIHIVPVILMTTTTAGIGAIGPGPRTGNHHTGDPAMIKILLSLRKCIVTHSVDYVR